MDKINKPIGYSGYFSVFILAFLILTSCANKAKENTALVHSAAQKIHADNKVDEALLLLKTVEVDQLSEYEYAYCILVQVRAWDFAGVSIAMADTAVVKSRDYFSKINDAEKAALAEFTLGRIYEKQGNATKALHSYRQADDWAAKANYTIANFNYSRIPYNIAAVLSNDLNFEESIKYCDKALAAINNENSSHVDKLYALELKSVNYIHLKNTDSALAYNDKAQEIAVKYNDNESKHRIAISRISAISAINDDYVRAEKEGKQLFSTISPTDSIHRGYLYVALADIYLKTQRVDSSLYYIHQSKQLLANADLYLKIPLYKRLYTIEREKGNTAAANEFERQYKQLKEAQLKLRQAQLDEIKKGESQKEAQQVQERLFTLEGSWLAGQKRVNVAHVLIYVVFACLAFIIILILRERKLRISGYEEYCRLKFIKETQMRNILQHNDLIRLHAWSEDSCEPSPFRDQLLAKIERMIPDAHWELDPKMYVVNYRTMLYNFQVDYPYLDDLEYGTLCLVCTDLYTEDERAEILEISLEHYQRVEKAVHHKFNGKGLVFEDIVNQSRAEYHIMPIDTAEYLSPRRYIIWRRKFIRMFKKIGFKG